MMDGHSGSPEPRLLDYPPQNTSTPARKACSDGGSGSEESIRDEEESLEYSEDDLDGFLKNAEGLSDQTFGGGDMRLYEYSLSTDVEKSLSHSNHHTLNECSTPKRHFLDLSCSELVDMERSLQSWREGEKNTPDAKEELVETLHKELVKAHEKIRVLKTRNDDLSTSKNELEEFIKLASERTSKFIPKIRDARDNVEFANLSVCSLEQKNNCSPNITGDNFQLSSLVRHLDQDLTNLETQQQESRSSQTTPSCMPSEDKTTMSNNNNNNKLVSLSQNIDNFRKNMVELKQQTKQGIFEAKKEIHQFTSVMQQMINEYENEISASKHKTQSDQKHYQEIISTLKDDIKTMKMRNQEMMKHKDQEIRELKSRVPETILEVEEKVENAVEVNIPSSTPDIPNFDDSFSSSSSTVDDAFMNTSLTRMKMEYLKLTPSEFVDNEVIEGAIPEPIRQLIEDKNLKYKDLEKKFEANKRYLEDMTHERESEREEFQQNSMEHLNQIEDLRKDNAKLIEDKKELMYKNEELTIRLKNAEENEMEIAQKWEKSDSELKAAVEKIYELREIVREQECRIDEVTQNVIHLEEQKQALRDELEKQELLSKKEQPIFKEQDSYSALPLDVDEIHHQLQDLSRRIEDKVAEMDSVQLHTRPGSSCSGVASAVSTEDISCREAAGRACRNLENSSFEQMESAIFNEIHRLESHVENLVRYDDVFIKKLKDSELQNMGQKAKIEDLENQMAIYQEKCSKQMLEIADLEGKIDALRFESSNQGLISSLQSRLSTACKQIDDLRIMLASKEKELTQIRTEYNVLRTKQQEREVEKTNASSQTHQLFEETMNYDLNYEGVSPEKIRRMDNANQLNASVISLSRTLPKNSQAMNFEPEISILESFHESGRSGSGGKPESYGGGDSCAAESSKGDITIKEMDDSLHQLQQLLQEKDKEISYLNRKLASAGQNIELKENHDTSNKCEQESIVIDTELNPGASPMATRKSNVQNSGAGAGGGDSTYEISYSHDYEVEGDMLKYLGTKLLYQGPRKGEKSEEQKNIGDQGERRIQETDRQIEVATLHTHLHQLKRALEDEKRNSEDLRDRLKACEEDKALLRAQSPMVVRAPVQNIVSTVSVQQMQQIELARQIEEGRKLLREKDKEIRSLKGHVVELEAKISSKEKDEKELMIRLNNTISMLRRCEDHGRELTANNQEQVTEIRRLRTQLDRANINRNNENIPQGSGPDYFENFMRAKSHRKALAWQKKYLSSVVLGYKSILRQNGHGNEHPDLLQVQIPIAPGAVGYLDVHNPKTRFRIGVLSVIATLRMKYMVSRWGKKRPGETSPDSEYKASRQSIRVEPNVIRPKRAILMHSRVNSTAPPPVGNNANVHESRRLGDISQYFSRFTTIENELSSSLSRNRPSN